MIFHGVEISIAGGGADEKDDAIIHQFSFIPENSNYLLFREKR